MKDREMDHDALSGVGPNDTPILPPAAMFAIPTHATTHASSSMAESAEEQEADMTAPLQGRPMPSSMVLDEEAYLTQPDADGTGKRTRKGIWRSADTILANNMAALQIDHDQSDLHPSPEHHLFDDPRQIGSSASPYVEEAKRGVILPPLVTHKKVPQGPPKYRRGRFVVSPETPPDYDEANAGLTAVQPVRFPRWRGWLEKRALERSIDQISTSTKDGQVHRKKSWGTGVNDADAVSEATEQESEASVRRTSPLHIHHFGSRFIPHLPSLPLCAVSLDLPPSQSWSTARLLRRSTPEDSKRRVLLIGAEDGLYAAEFKKEKRADEMSWSDSLQRRELEKLYRRQGNESQLGKWNGNVRTCKIWSGVGVFQMSVLLPQVGEAEPKMTLYGMSTQKAQETQETGILLALCSPVKKESSRINTTYKPNQSSSHPDLISAIGASTSSSLGHGQREALTTSLLSSAYVGTGGGGGHSKPTPPHGAGDVRMWNVEAIRRIVAHVLDSADHKPLDLTRSSRSNGRESSKPFALASRIRRAWAQLGDPSSERKRFSRQATSEASPVSPSGSATARPNRFSTSGDYFDQRNGAPHLVHTRAQSEQLLPGNAMYSPGERCESPMEEPNASDSAHQECLRLAHGWVPLSLPGAQPYSAAANMSTRTDSVSSLFSEEHMLASPSGTGMIGGSSSPVPPAPSLSHGRGIAFYALIEAGKEVQGAGTWYLALVQGKSILLYESIKPLDKGDARTWAFVKEFYTPVQAKAVSFCFSESPDPDEVLRSSYTSAAHSSSSKRQLAARRSVKSSSYSSVFRSHPSLNIFVSLGRKAVLIRASDGSVKELELCPVLRRFNTDGAGDQHAASSDVGHPLASKSSAGHGSHGRRISEVPESMAGASSKEQWIGLERMTAQVVLRCKAANRAGEGSALAQSGATPSAAAVEDDDEEWDSDEGNDGGTAGHGVTLRDTPAIANVSSILRRPQRAQLPAYTVFAGLAALSKGTETHVLPLPLPRDLFQPRPLHVVHWSAQPTGVTASARVVGLERDLSSATVPVDSLGRTRDAAGTRSPSAAASLGNDVNDDDDIVGPTTRRGDAVKSNMVILHVVIALLATLPSRVEMKRVRIRLPVRMPFAFRRDSELELQPTTSSADANLSYAEDEGNSVSPTASGDQANVLESHQELEYLCAMALPTQFDQSTAIKPWEAAGDGGAWAFDWRGANDFRLFYVGTQI